MARISLNRRSAGMAVIVGDDLSSTFIATCVPSERDTAWYTLAKVPRPRSFVSSYFPRSWLVFLVDFGVAALAVAVVVAAASIGIL